MKKTHFLLLSTALTFTFCSEEDIIDNTQANNNTIEDEANTLIEIEASQPIDNEYKDFYIITKTDGSLIDSATLSPSNLVKLKGPDDIEKFTLTRVFQGYGATYLYAFFEISQSKWNLLSGTNKSTTINLDISPDMSHQTGSYIISGHSHRYENITSSYNEFNTSRDNKIFASWEPHGEVPLFKMFENLTSGSTLNISPGDFTNEMSAKSVSSTLDWFISDLRGKENNSTYQIKSGKKSDSEFYYPTYDFDHFISTFGFEDEAFVGGFRTLYHGNLPDEINKLDIKEFTNSKDLANYSLVSTNENVSVIKSRFYQRDPVISINITGPNDEINIEGLVNTLNEVLPNLNLDVSKAEWRQVDVLEITGKNYDNYISDEFLSNDRVGQEIKTYLEIGL